MAYKICTYCGTNANGKDTACPSCSAPLENKIVAEAGNLKDNISVAVCEAVESIKATIKFNNQKKQEKNNNPKSNTSKANVRMANKWITMFLLLVAGIFGVHKFYEGKIVLGIIYIFTGAFIFIGVIVDFF